MDAQVHFTGAMPPQQFFDRFMRVEDGLSTTLKADYTSLVHCTSIKAKGERLVSAALRDILYFMIFTALHRFAPWRNIKSAPIFDYS